MRDFGGDRRVQIGDLVVDPTTQRAEFLGREIRLTPIEFDLLHALLESPGRVLSPSSIGAKVWKYDSPPPTLITVHMANLRRKLRERGVPSVIETVRGVGYRAVHGNGDRIFHDEPPFIGREQELRLLQGTFAKMRTASGKAIVLLGETGVGKTRLLREFVDSLSNSVPRALVTCDSMAEPYAVWRDVLSGLSVCVGPPGVLAKESASVRSRFCDLGQSSSAEGLTEAETDVATLDAIREISDHDGVRRPIVIAVDDVSSADAASLRLLHKVMQQCEQTNIMLVAALRSHAAAHFLSASDAQPQLLVLEPFKLDESGRLARAAIGTLEDSVAKAIHERTEGNPLLLTEVLRALQAGGASNGDVLGQLTDVARFPNLRAVVAQWLRRLEAKTVEALQVGALLGHSFDVRLAVDVVSSTSDELMTALGPAIDDWILVQEQEPFNFAFRHALIREILYANLSHRQRMELHLAAARGLAQRDGRSHSGELAWHYYNAAGLGVEAEAAEALQVAASEAASCGDFSGAVLQLERARSLQPSPAIAEALGDALIPALRPVDAMEAYSAAIACLSSEPLERARLLAKLAAAAIEARLWEEAATAIRQGRAALGTPSEDRVWWGTRIEVGLQEMWLAYYTGQAMDQDVAGNWQSRMHEYSSTRQQISFQRCRYLQLMRRDRHRPQADAVAAGRAQWELSRETGSPVERMLADGMYSVALLWSGEISAARHHLTDGLLLAQQLGSVAVEMIMLGNLSTADRLQGDVRRCEERSRRILELASQGDWPDHIGGALGNLAWVALRDGDAVTAVETARASLQELARVPAFPFRWLAVWPLVAGLADSDPDASIAYTRDLLDPSQQALEPEVERPLVELLESYAAGDTKGARSKLGHILGLTCRHGYT